MLSPFPSCRLWQRKLRKGVGGGRIEGQRSLRALCTWQQVKEGGASGETRQLEAPTWIRHEVFLCLRPQPKCFFYIPRGVKILFENISRKKEKSLRRKMCVFLKARLSLFPQRKQRLSGFRAWNAFWPFQPFLYSLKTLFESEILQGNYTFKYRKQISSNRFYQTMVTIRFMHFHFSSNHAEK